MEIGARLRLGGAGDMPSPGPLCVIAGGRGILWVGMVVIMDNRFDSKEMDAVLGRVFPENARRAGEGELKRLREGMDRAAALSDAYAELAAKSRDGRNRRLFSELAAGEKADMRSLQAAHFIISGDRYAPDRPKRDTEPLPETLRQLYLTETGAAAEYGRAALAAGDSALSMMYSRLADSGQRHGDSLARLIESMMK